MAGVTTVSKLSLAQSPAVAAAHYLPLFSNGGSGNVTSTASGTTFISISGGSTTTKSTATNLHTLDNWLPSTQFAFEAPILAQTGGTGYAALWDMTSNAIVTGSQISTTSSTVAVFRSAKFSLTPGHVYGITLWSSSSSYYVQLLSGAWIVAFPSS